MIKIKTRTATLFADMNLKVEQFSSDVLRMSQTFQKWQERKEDPISRIEAQLYSLKNIQEEAERTHEAKNAKVTQSIKSLIGALLAIDERLSLSKIETANVFSV
jgi:hypothetical protein